MVSLALLFSTRLCPQPLMYILCSGPLPALVALRWAYSSMTVSFINWGNQSGRGIPEVFSLTSGIYEGILIVSSSSS